MSIDIYMVIDTGLEESVVCDVGNFTHNTQPMWTLALKETGSDLHLCQFNGMSASTAILVLEKAVAYMYLPEHQEAFEQLNPENGWGDFQGARQFLEKLLVACKNYPKCTIRTSC